MAAIAILQKLHCRQTEDSTRDHVQLRSQGRHVWPGSEGDFGITTNTSADMNEVIFLGEGNAGVELWEEDWPDPDDNLGTIDIFAGEAGQGQKVKEFNRDDEARYNLYYTVHRF